MLAAASAIPHGTLPRRGRTPRDARSAEASSSISMSSSSQRILMMSAAKNPANGNLSLWHLSNRQTVHQPHPGIPTVSALYQCIWVVVLSRSGFVRIYPLPLGGHYYWIFGNSVHRYRPQTIITFWVSKAPNFFPKRSQPSVNWQEFDFFAWFFCYSTRIFITFVPESGGFGNFSGIFFHQPQGLKL